MDAMTYFRPVLTTNILSISPDLSIPLCMIKELELINKDRAIRILYHNAYNGKDVIYALTIRTFLGFYNRNRVLELYSILQDLTTLATPDLDAHKQAAAIISASSACEKCGHEETEYISLGQCVSIGIPLIAGYASWGSRDFNGPLKNHRRARLWFRACRFEAPPQARPAGSCQGDNEENAYSQSLLLQQD